MAERTRKAFKLAGSMLLAVALAGSCYYLGMVGTPLALAETSAESGEQVQQEERDWTVSPFVMERKLISYTRDPNGELVRKDIRGRASDGTLYSKVIPVLSRPGETIVRHVMLPDGRSYNICDEKQIRTTKALTGIGKLIYQRLVTPAEWEQAWTSGLPVAVPAAGEQPLKTGMKLRCGDRFERFAGRDVVAGYPVQVWQKEYLGANQFLVRMSYYRARCTSCIPLKEVFEEQGSDHSYTRRWEIVPYSIEEVEPPAEDLHLGEGYREVTPAEFKELAGWRPHDVYNLVGCGTRDCQESVMRESAVSGKPDFNGRWKLDLEESWGSQGERLRYGRFTLTIAHNEPWLDIIHQVSKTRKNQRLMRFALTTDGKPKTNGRRMAVAWWEGETLVYRYAVTQKDGRGPLQVERRMRLSDDGLTMYAETKATDQNGVHPTTGTELWHKKPHPLSAYKMQASQKVGR